MGVTHTIHIISYMMMILLRLIPVQIDLTTTIDIDTMETINFIDTTRNIMGDISLEKHRGQTRRSLLDPEPFSEVSLQVVNLKNGKIYSTTQIGAIF